MTAHAGQRPHRLWTLGPQFSRTSVRGVDSDATSPILSEEQAHALSDLILRLTTADRFSIAIEHTMQSSTRLANGQVLMNNDGEMLWLSLSATVGRRYPGSLTINQIDEPTVRAAVQTVDRLARQQLGPLEALGEEPLGPQPIPTVHLWKMPTVAALMGTSPVRETAVPQMFDALMGADLVGAGVVEMMARSTFFRYSSGLSAYNRETDARCNVTARTPDGKSSGWAGQAARDWSMIDPRAVAMRAVEMAKRAAHPTALEPGRRVAILSATACAQLIRAVTNTMSALGADRGDTPFSKRGGGSKFGQRILDPRLTMWSNPDDPDGGCLPFYDAGDGPDTIAGLPLSPITWVEHGILQDLQYGVGYGALRGKRYNRLPRSLHMAPITGTATMTVEEMIAACQEGIYVNRFSNVNLVDMRSGMTTGVTRDGCFLIKNGKFDKAIQNFRILDSPFFFLNNLDAIGVAERVDIQEDFGKSSSFPMIAPPVMVRDFNFVALSDAV